MAQTHVQTEGMIQRPRLRFELGQSQLSKPHPLWVGDSLCTLKLPGKKRGFQPRCLEQETLFEGIVRVQVVLVGCSTNLPSRSYPWSKNWTNPAKLLEPPSWVFPLAGATPTELEKSH